MDGQKQAADEQNVIFVTAGKAHNLKNTGRQDLKLFTIYSPPAHAAGTVHKTREGAMREEAAGPKKKSSKSSPLSKGLIQRCKKLLVW